jgi:hypothetical protein
VRSTLKGGGGDGGHGGDGGGGGGRGGHCSHGVTWITRRYYDVSKDYSEFLGPKHKSVLAAQKVFWQNTSCESVLDFQNTFEIYLLGLFIHISERNSLFNARVHTENLSRNRRLQEI